MTTNENSRRMTRPVCAECGATTMGLIISTQGGARVASIASERSRRVYCGTCADARIDAMNLRDRQVAAARSAK
jgi:hypothetical protein